MKAKKKSVAPVWRKSKSPSRYEEEWEMRTGDAHLTVARREILGGYCVFAESEALVRPVWVYGFASLKEAKQGAIYAGILTIQLAASFAAERRARKAGKR